MLDVIEHLAKPELFLEQLRSALSLKPSVDVFLSTANIGFLVTRFMLLIGQFNYGKRGILDLTHTRLFTFGSFERAVKQAGFDIVERVGVPGPIPLALGDNFLSRTLMKINQAADPRFARFVLLSDVSAGQAPALAGTAAANGAGAIEEARGSHRNSRQHRRADDRRPGAPVLIDSLAICALWYAS